MASNWSTIPVVSKPNSKPASNNNKPPKKQQSAAASIPGTAEYAAAQSVKPKNSEKKKVESVTGKELSQKEMDILVQNSMGYNPKPTKVSQAVTGTSGRQAHRGAKS